MMQCQHLAPSTLIAAVNAGMLICYDAALCPRRFQQLPAMPDQATTAGSAGDQAFCSAAGPYLELGPAMPQPVIVHRRGKRRVLPPLCGCFALTPGSAWNIRVDHWQTMT